MRVPLPTTKYFDKLGATSKAYVEQLKQRERDLDQHKQATKARGKELQQQLKSLSKRARGLRRQWLQSTPDPIQEWVNIGDDDLSVKEGVGELKQLAMRLNDSVTSNRTALKQERDRIMHESMGLYEKVLDVEKSFCEICAEKAMIEDKLDLLDFYEEREADVSAYIEDHKKELRAVLKSIPGGDDLQKDLGNGEDDNRPKEGAEKECSMM